MKLLVLIIFVFQRVSCQSRLWYLLDHKTNCDDRRATECYLVYPYLNRNTFANASYITIPGLGFDHVTFLRRHNWEIRGQYLAEFEVPQDSRHYGHITLLYNDKHVWGFIDFDNQKFSLVNLPHGEMGGLKLLKKWSGNFSSNHQPPPEQGRSRQLLPEDVTMPDLVPVPTPYHLHHL